MQIRKNGFSLVELLVVMGIIAVLAALVTYNFNSARARARDLQRKSDLKALQQALELYKNDNGQAFPVSPLWTDLMTALQDGSYIRSDYNDPKEGLKAGSWLPYSYQRTSALTYTITACLENRTDEDASATPCGVGGTGAYYYVSEP